MGQLGQTVHQYSQNNKVPEGTSAFKMLGDAIRWSQTPSQPSKPAQPEYTGTTRNNSILTSTNGDASTGAVRRKKLMGSSLLGE